METFRVISLTACFLGIVMTIFSRLYPSEKFEKQIKTIFSLIFLLAVVSPLVKGKIRLPDLDATITAGSGYYHTVSRNADIFFIKALEKNINSSLMSELNKEKIFPLEIKTSVNISEDNSISINEVRVIVQNEEQIEKVKDNVLSSIGENTKVVVETKEGQYEY